MTKCATSAGGSWRTARSLPRDRRRLCLNLVCSGSFDVRRLGVSFLLFPLSGWRRLAQAPAIMGRMPTLHAQSIAKTYPVADGELTILRDASLALERGESAAIVGPSGSGKSTLLSILGTLDFPTAGTFELNSESPFKLSEPELAAFRSRHIGFIFQDHHLLPQCSVLENVLVPLLADGAAGPADVTHAEQLLERVGLAERRHHRPAQLSGGERQRAAIARALLRQPTLLLADEPTGNLDRTTADAIVNLLLELQQEQNAILIAVTHSEPLAARLQRRYALDDGRLIKQ
jgi:lipoprotein-releasing system ATP-binding protein